MVFSESSKEDVEPPSQLIAQVVTQCFLRYGRDIELGLDSSQTYTRAVGDVEPIKKEGKVLGYYIPIQPSVSFLSPDLWMDIKAKLLDIFPKASTVLTQEAILLFVDPALSKSDIHSMVNEYTEAILKDKPLEFPPEFNETEARKLGLERLELGSYATAERLMQEVIAGTIDIETQDGQTRFCTEWVQAHPELPLPCLPNEKLWFDLYKYHKDKQSYPRIPGESNGYFWYLIKLKNKKITRNLTGIYNQDLHPKFDETQVIWVDNYTKEFEHTDGYSLNEEIKLQFMDSSILKILLPSQYKGVVNVTRKNMDLALWQGDPNLKKSTPQHVGLLQQLGLDPNMFEFRYITHDEYTRGSITHKLGWEGIQTMLYGFYSDYDGRLDLDYMLGLISSYHMGVSWVAGKVRRYGNSRLAVRLVLARK